MKDEETGESILSNKKGENYACIEYIYNESGLKEEEAYYDKDMELISETP